MISEQGIAALISALPKITSKPDDKAARSEALYGAWLCAISLGSGGVALHHKLCHVLGGSFELPHAETHTIVLPHALAYNEPEVPDAMRHLRRATGSDNPAQLFFDIAKSGGAPTSLQELGMPEAGIDQAVKITMDNPYYNPRPLDRDAIRTIVRAAWSGERP